jgi:cytochrome subunit of sulfide dehydrogenase
MTRKSTCAAFLLVALGSAAQAQTMAADAQSARYLAANCANCHGTNGHAQGAMPSLAGQQKAYLVEQMKAFREGRRPATIMHQLAKGYTEPQVELIAEYFSQQKTAR